MVSCPLSPSESLSRPMTAKPSILTGSSDILLVLVPGFGKFLPSGLAFLGPGFLLALTGLCGAPHSTWHE